jgi:thiol-disulfide isomerase/thioredoxin
VEHSNPSHHSKKWKKSERDVPIIKTKTKASLNPQSYLKHPFQKMENHGNAHIVESDEEFEALIWSAEEKLVVVDFFATWCGKLLSLYLF